MSKIKLFTHTDLDGIGCAVLAYLAFKDDVDVEFCDYKDIDEKVNVFLNKEFWDKTYDKIFITDISVSERMAEVIDCDPLDSKRLDVTLLDHHATAEWLNKYEWATVEVRDCNDVKTSGTMMFYRYLLSKGLLAHLFDYHIDNVSRFARIVRDYDTWRWKDDKNLGYDGIICKQVNDIFHIYGRNEFINWSICKIKDRLARPYPNFDHMDKLILENKQKDIDNYVSQKNKQLMTVKDNFGYTCGVVFAERYVSELGNRLSELHPELDYIAMIDIGFGGVSYRTVKDDIDLGGEIAHSFGGGGHKKAAGSTFNSISVRDNIVGHIFELDRLRREIVT